MFAERGNSVSQADLPVKIVPRKSAQEQRTLFWIEQDGQILAWQRPAESRLMPGFWELPEAEQIPSATLLRKLGSFRHGITFHNYVFDVWETEMPASAASFKWLALVICNASRSAQCSRRQPAWYLTEFGGKRPFRARQLGGSGARL